MSQPPDPHKPVPPKDTKMPPQDGTSDEENMQATLPEHGDDKGTKVEDLAGTGEVDSLGG